MSQNNRDSKKKLLIVVAMACWLVSALLIQAYIGDKKNKLQKEAEMFRQRVAAETAARQVKKVPVLVAARSVFSGAIPPHVNIVGVDYSFAYL